MKLEYLGNTGDSLYDKILRLYHFNTNQTMALIEVIQHELIELRNDILLNKLDFIEPVNCELNLRLSQENPGIVPLGNNKFNCEMDLINYSNLIEMLQDSTGDDAGYYWLDNDCDSDICFLYSEGGGW